MSGRGTPYYINSWPSSIPRPNTTSYPCTLASMFARRCSSACVGAGRSTILDAAPATVLDGELHGPTDRGTRGRRHGSSSGEASRGRAARGLTIQLVAGKAGKSQGELLSLGIRDSGWWVEAWRPRD